MRGWAMFLSGALLAAACSTVPARSQQATRPITVQEAASLVRIAVEYQIRDVNPGGPFSLDPSNEPDTNYYSFQALAVWHPEETGSAVLGSYIVDRRTAEVWNADDCKKTDFPALATLQKHIRASIGLSKRAYLSLARTESPPVHC